ncbi:hypothetical protein [Streptosporangium sp. NPDC006007]|uniref:hypothetical protein n=1 Tax=Streptosporangium sp. NPDC006007 TaxID=3154575 RepID=UPI0033BA8961
MPADIRPAAIPRIRRALAAHLSTVTLAAGRAVAVALVTHRLFAALLASAAALRVVTMLGYRPALLYWYDSFTYLDAAVHLKPASGFHPIGYPLLLRALWPFHSVEVIAGVQHAMGLGTGLMLYALLRRRSLPVWAAAPAAVPVLFDASFLRLEHAVLSDTPFIFLVVAGLTTLMWSPRLSVRAALGAGLLFAAAALTRTIALPLFILIVLMLAVRLLPAVRRGEPGEWQGGPQGGERSRRRGEERNGGRGRRRSGWWPLGVMTVAGIVPLVAYAGWYGHHHGRFALSGSDGVALWARTMTFADCSVIKPPPPEARLCPNGSTADAASEYVWAPDSALNRLPGDRFSHNDLARSFALRAIAAQPLDYLHDIARDTALTFAWTPIAHPGRTTPAFGFAHGYRSLPGRPLIDEMREVYAPDIRGQRSVRPYSDLLIAYQYPAYLRGPLIGVILLVGAVGAVLRWRGVPLPWVVAMFLLVAPVAVLDFDHRYVLPVIPVACLAAAPATVKITARIAARIAAGIRAGG